MTSIRICTVLACLLLGATAHGGSAQLARYTVTAARVPLPLTESLFSISRIDERDVDIVGAVHPNELFARVPGTWVSRGSGQEHLTAIRSPILTGGGACGAFLYLEDGIPVRPAGFCNVNQLFEINTEQADAIEVLRGPGPVIYGSNALHGVVNVLHEPLGVPLHEVSASAGEYGYRRIGVDYSDVNLYGGWRAKYFGETQDSIQRDAGHEQHKLNLGWHGDYWRAQIAASSLEQDTAGYILGENAWRDPVLKRSNPNPEAFRAADALRAWAVLERPTTTGMLVFRPFARWSDMDFRQHFLPGKPLEENGQTSAGLITSYASDGRAVDWSAGLDLEWADIWLTEIQDDPAEGSDFLRETRPQGVHYDYEVAQLAASPWLNAEYALGDDTQLVAGVRGDWIRYDYDNRVAAGNLRDDGTACGFGGCIYNRPADRTDTWSVFSPKLGIRRVFEATTLYANAVQGFRVPQTSELYRLQRGQDVADLDPVRVDSIELGARGASERFAYDLAAFAMQKRNVIFRDAEGFNVSDGETRHRGIEFDLQWQFDERWLAALRGTYAIHEYAFDYLPDDGEQFVSGRAVDTAPKSLGSALLRWLPTPATTLEFEYTHTGSYYLDAENTQRYPGHGLWHARWRQDLDAFTLYLRVNNLLDEEYAERADYAWGDFRYFPGWPRRVNVTLAYAW